MQSGFEQHNDECDRDPHEAFPYDVDDEGGVFLELTPEELAEDALLEALEEKMMRERPIVLPAWCVWAREYDCDDSEDRAAASATEIDTPDAPPTPVRQLVESLPRAADRSDPSGARVPADHASCLAEPAPRRARRIRGTTDPCFTPAARRLVDFVRALGAVPLHLAVRMAGILDDESGRITYAASSQLHKAGVIGHRLARRDLNVPRVCGLEKLLVPGPQFRDWSDACPDHVGTRAESHPARVAPGALSLTAPDAVVREQLALAYAVLGRIVRGWRVASGDEWLRNAVDLAMKASPPTGYGVWLGRARDRGGCRLGAKHRVFGLLPPEVRGDDDHGEVASEDAPKPKPGAPSPCVIVGGTWMARSDVDDAFPKLRYSISLDVLAALGSNNAANALQTRVRELARPHTMTARVKALRTDRLEDWDRIASEVDDAFGSTSRDVVRTRLRDWLARSGG